MPNVKGKNIAPEKAVKKGLCPECGQPLEGTDIEGHIQHHWPLGRSAEAVARIAMLRDYATANPPKPEEEEEDEEAAPQKAKGK